MSEFDQLKDLLLGEERAARNAQAKLLADKLDASFADLPQLLPDLLKRAQHDDRLARALEKPLAQGFERIARTQKTLLISVLFPLIGPVIRRSIAETLSQLMKDMNRAVEHSISPTGLRWRWEALKTGVPFTQVVLKHTLRYRVEHLLLVNNDGGLLLAHVANVDAELADSDAVAGMLSALQDFARDAVLARPDEALKSVEVGGMTLKILRGPLMHLAIAVRGELSEPALTSLIELVETLHDDVANTSTDLEANKAEFRDLITDWMLKNGQESSEAIDDARAQSKAKPVLLKVIAALLASALLAWCGALWWHAHKAAQLEVELTKSPGILARVHYSDGQYHVVGNRDPFADSIIELAGRIKIPADRIEQAKLSAYLSLEPLLWQRRLRASGQLPEALNLTRSGHAIKINGEIDGATLIHLRRNLSVWQTLLAFDFSGIKVIDGNTRRKRFELMRQLAQLRVDLSDADLKKNASLQTLIDQCHALLDSSPNQRLYLTVVEFVQDRPLELSARGLAAAAHLRAALQRVAIQLIPVAANRAVISGAQHGEAVNTLALSAVSLR
jgi:ABC-type transporter Mla MlaB component